LTPSSAAALDYESRLALRGSGPGLVLVPGMDGTGELFYRQAPVLASRYRVATYALRDEATRMETLTADLARVVEEAAPGEGRAVIVGESFGGTLAMSFALQYPERVRALVVLNSFPYFEPQARLRLAIAGLAVLPWGAMSLVRHATAFRMHSRHTGREEIRRFIRLTEQTKRSGYVNRLRILTEYDIRERLAEISAPTLFLAAEKDHLVPSVAQAGYMAARVPGATLRVLPGHGHICLIAPDVDLAQILREWGAAGGAKGW
jgi:pimeloyl-ACP methyl ester carboxylesterase